MKLANEMKLTEMQWHDVKWNTILWCDMKWHENGMKSYEINEWTKWIEIKGNDNDMHQMTWN